MCPQRIIAHVSLCALVLAALVVAAPAVATPPPAAIAQYVETVPSASSRPTARRTVVAPVAKAVVERIAAQGHVDAGALKQVVSNPSLGAPVDKPTKLRRHRSFAAYARTNLGSAVADVVGGSGTLLALGGGLLGLTAFVTAAGLVARRPRGVTARL